MVMVSRMTTGTAMATAMVEGSETAMLAPSRTRLGTRTRARERAKPKQLWCGRGQFDNGLGAGEATRAT
jgi:hypothetical protein